MQVIGICRFSFPAIGGFQVRHDTIQERIAYLYAPERMAQRFATFEAFTLPCLRAQTDSDFKFVIIVGDMMPAQYLAHLHAITRDIPQITIQARAPGRHRKVMSSVINDMRTVDRDPTLQFRLDDDDAVAVHFVAELRRRAAQAQPILSEFRSVAIDFNQGFIARPGADGIKAAPVRKPYWTPGLAVMLQPQTKLTIMNFSHQKIWQRMPTLTFPGEDMMLRGFNDYNDSRQRKSAHTQTLTLLDADHEEYFKMAYNIDADHVRALFSPAHQAAFAVEGK